MEIATKNHAFVAVEFLKNVPNRKIVYNNTFISWSNKIPLPPHKKNLKIKKITETIFIELLNHIISFSQLIQVNAIMGEK